MGWSCREDAGRTMDLWTQVCRATTGSSNVYRVKGKTYFWEVSRVEHEDGAITGYICRMNRKTKTARKVGTFRIEPTGEISRAPKFLKNCAV